MLSRLFFVLAGSCLAGLAAAQAPLAGNESPVRGHHPFNEGLNIWFYGLDTALGGHLFVGDVVDQQLGFRNFRGEPRPIHRKEDETADNYENTHNHYQNLFVQTINKVGNVNAVSIWGDSTSVVNGAKSWGGFFSARSSCESFSARGPFSAYGGHSLDECVGHDNQLIGVEIDVLNASKPGIFPNMSKTGLQIVGFGNPNSMAVEVRSEDSDRAKPGTPPGGAFESILYIKNAIQPQYGRMLVADFEQAKMGLDFRRPIFTEGAFSFRSEGVGTGVVLNEGRSGEMYGGERWPGAGDKGGWLTLRLGDAGLRVANNDNTREAIAIDNFGGVYLNGDVYINQRRLDEMISSNPWTDIRFISFAIAITLLNLMVSLSLRHFRGDR